MANSRVTSSAALGCLLISFLLSGCRSDEISLVDGYKLVRMNGCERRIWHPAEKEYGDRMTGGNVREYAVRGQYITGYEDNTCLPTETHPKVGYFAIDTQTRVWREDLTESDWRSLMGDWGWQNPQMIKLR